MQLKTFVYFKELYLLPLQVLICNIFAFFCIFKGLNAKKMQKKCMLLARCSAAALLPHRPHLPHSLILNPPFRIAATVHDNCKWGFSSSLSIRFSSSCDSEPPSVHQSVAFYLHFLNTFAFKNAKINSKKCKVRPSWILKEVLSPDDMVPAQVSIYIFFAFFLHFLWICFAFLKH